MPIFLETALQLAERIASARHSSKAASIATTLRDLIGRGVILPTMRAGSGKTAPVLLSTSDAARAIILLHLNRLGLSHELLTALAEKPDKDISRNIDACPPATSEAVIASVLERIRKGSKVFFHVHLTGEFYDLPGDVIDAFFSEDHRSPAPHAFTNTIITVQLLPLLGPLFQSGE